MITSEWDSQELPPEARARLTQARAGHTWTSSLSVNEFAALRAVGFEPVGAVMGSTVHDIGWWYNRPRDCGYRPEPRVERYDRFGQRILTPSVTITTKMHAASGGYYTYIQTLYRARRAAMERMAAECAALGGDGVVSVRLDIAPFMGAPNRLEFQAFGTAVQARGPGRPGRVFLSHVSGQEFGKLIAAGWVPVGLALGASIGVRHDDEQTERATRRRAPRAGGRGPDRSRPAHPARRPPALSRRCPAERRGGRRAVDHGTQDAWPILLARRWWRGPRGGVDFHRHLDHRVPDKTSNASLADLHATVTQEE